MPRFNEKSARNAAYRLLQPMVSYGYDTAEFGAPGRNGVSRSLETGERRYVAGISIYLLSWLEERGIASRTDDYRRFSIDRGKAEAFVREWESQSVTGSRPITYWGRWSREKLNSL